MLERDADRGAARASVCQINKRWPETMREIKHPVGGQKEEITRMSPSREEYAYARYPQARGRGADNPSRSSKKKNV